MDNPDGTKAPKPPRPSLRKFYQLLKYPPHLIVSFNGAFQFCGLYAIYITFPKVWEKEYGWSSGNVGFAYLSPGLAIFIASFVVGRVSDAMRNKALKDSPDGKVAPERRLPIQLIGFAIAAGGKLLYGWGTRYKLHAAVPLGGAALAATGTAIIFVTSTSFQTECDPTQAATLVALGGLLRNLAAAVGSVIMDTLIQKMGYGWCLTGLAVLDILCVPGILLIMTKGKKFREQLNRQTKS
jgi:predicted MFS family arabinose efflux permease